MSKLLVVIDMQNDFIDGTLGTGEAVQIVDKVVDKIKNYERNGDTIIFTKDTHSDNYLDTQEGKNLPVKHCIAKTNGWKISSKICNITDISKYKIYEKVTFGSSELAKDLMNGVYDTVSQIELIGLCTDICVISNALLIKTFLPEIPVAVDASCCAGVTKESHANALEAMKMCQINILNQ
ncbi:cysteine hydrolase family protein [Anaerocolumna sp. MB42-C2]|uniref:cysteine hydrolase family protein n=1 Tax=Anaerocolumna sp. MB42-C2 TaxID=3070997 RepID=UPI0027E1A7C2|nr:isochorismatase family cysteine hydrolase [Anaerocolumna sp. MB42-C2]WMJ89622.1 isochorismatase family cysteine hydrolase [Anaerocolumna sp. MB42-C2]